MNQAEPMKDEELRKYFEAKRALHAAANSTFADCPEKECQRARAVLSLLDRAKELERFKRAMTPLCSQCVGKVEIVHHARAQCAGCGVWLPTPPAEPEPK